MYDLETELVFQTLSKRDYNSFQAPAVFLISVEGRLLREDEERQAVRSKVP